MDAYLESCVTGIQGGRCPCCNNQVEVCFTETNLSLMRGGKLKIGGGQCPTCQRKIYAYERRGRVCFTAKEDYETMERMGVLVPRGTIYDIRKRPYNKYPQMMIEGPMTGQCPSCRHRVLIDFAKCKGLKFNGDTLNLGRGHCPQCHVVVYHRYHRRRYEWFVAKTGFAVEILGLDPAKLG